MKSDFCEGIQQSDSQIASGIVNIRPWVATSRGYSVVSRTYSTWPWRRPTYTHEFTFAKTEGQNYATNQTTKTDSFNVNISALITTVVIKAVMFTIKTAQL